MWWIILSGVLHNFNMYTIGSFIYADMQRYHHVSTAAAGQINSVLFGIGGLGILLGDTGHPEEALVLRSALVQHFRDVGDLNKLQGTLCNHAAILYARADLDGAMTLYIPNFASSAVHVGGSTGVASSTKAALSVGVPP